MSLIFRVYSSGNRSTLWCVGREGGMENDPDTSLIMIKLGLDRFISSFIEDPFYMEGVFIFIYFVVGGGAVTYQAIKAGQTRFCCIL